MSNYVKLVGGSLETVITFTVIFLTFLLTIGANLDDGFLARLGVDSKILFATLIAFVLTGLVAHRRLALVVVVVLMAIAANVPPEHAAELGYDPDALLAALFAVVLTPYVARHL